MHSHDTRCGSPVAYTADGTAIMVSSAVYELLHMTEMYGPLTTKRPARIVTKEVADAIAQHPEEAKRPDGIIPINPGPYGGEQPWWSSILKALP